MGLSDHVNWMNANPPKANRPASAGLPLSAALPKSTPDPRFTRTCCGVALEPFLASARNMSGDTVYTYCSDPRFSPV